MPRTPAVELACRRVEELDRRPLPIVGAEADPLLVRFASVLGSYTSASMGPPSGTTLVLAAADADEVVDGSALLEVFAGHDVDLVRGPLPRDRQQWIATGRHRRTSQKAPAPSRERFVAATDTPGPAPSAKPFDMGLFTSTATRGGPSGWRTILDLSRGSSLYPLPWYVWDLEVDGDASVLEITSARDWVAFVETFAKVAAEFVYPDWRSAATQFDGVHLTLAAIAAAQGFSFPTSVGLTAPAFWDVESTLWLRWAFGKTRLSHVVGPDGT